MEDLDRITSSPIHERAQLRDLAALGLEPDGPVVRQSERFERYHSAIATLAARGLVYPCYCTRREIREAAAAPHGDGPEGAYPGTCRDLSAAARRRAETGGRRPALRFRSDGRTVSFEDRLHGRVAGVVDDVVVQRNDGVPAYNLAVVVDDAAQAVSEVVRGDDLLSSTPRQLELGRLLGAPPPTYLHVPLVVGADGARLAKRHGAVTLGQLAETGIDSLTVRARLAESLGLTEPGERPSLDELVARFRAAALPHSPWRLAGTEFGAATSRPGRGSISADD
jgi:glutamyl-tRNA synthetase